MPLLFLNHVVKRQRRCATGRDAAPRDLLIGRSAWGTIATPRGLASLATAARAARSIGWAPVRAALPPPPLAPAAPQRHPSTVRARRVGRDPQRPPRG